MSHETEFKQKISKKKTMNDIICWYYKMNSKARLYVS